MSGPWSKRPLGELCDIELGRTPARANLSYWDDRKRTSNVWLSIADLLNADGYVVSDSAEYVSDEGAMLCKRVKKGTLLVSFKLTLGRLAYAGRDLFTNEAIAALNLKGGQVLKEYLFWYLQYFDWEKAAEGDEKVKGKTLNKAKLQVMPVAVPPIPEQQRIVAVLDETFAVIGTAKANSEKNLANARAFAASALESALSREGGRWPRRRLGDVLIIGSSKRIMEHEWTLSGVPFYGGREVVKLAAGEPFESNAFISEQKYLEVTRKYGVPSAGDILMTARGTIGVGYIVGESDKFYYKDGNLMCLHPREPLNPRFILYLFEAGEIKEQLSGLSGTTVTHLPIERANAIEARIPTKLEQDAFVARMELIRDEAKHLESLARRKLAALDALKASLLHHAFAGQLTGEGLASCPP